MPFTISLRRANDDDDALFPEAQHGHAHDNPEGGDEGRLAIDVYDGEREIVLITAIAGVRPEDIEVSLHNDMLTVRGTRAAEPAAGAKPLVRECHWGSFSRSIILPTAVDPDAIAATIQHGLLTVRLPKTDRSARIEVTEA